MLVKMPKFVVVMVGIRPKIKLGPVWWLVAETALTLCAFVVLFQLQRVVFLAVYGREAGSGFTGFVQALWAGAPMDLSTAGYLTAVPLMADMVYLWRQGSTSSKF